jgi:hypothetical protein
MVSKISFSSKPHTAPYVFRAAREMFFQFRWIAMTNKRIEIQDFKAVIEG